MPRLSDLAAGKRTTSFLPYADAPEDQRVTITYRPGMLTPIAAEYVNESIRGDDGPMLKWLSETLIEWDVLQDDSDDPAPFDVEALKLLPQDFLIAVVKAMYRGEQPGETKPDA